ncbi:hypothetical protein EYZ11_009603 [Aspergillus tanneri]|uniref:Uncharacterized protein n=1 Tax=Aspergillus tanneri TaxID=1220188 RepID=A0A4S3JCV9_9EURO|nr:hypothetical protein EYZ11_009603 [Aspergillus tanneri]
MKLHQPVDEDNLEYPVDEDDTDLRPTVPVSGARQDAEYWSPTVASVALFQLHDILGHVVKRLYPSKGVRKTKGQGPLRHLVSIDTVRELEGALRSWLDSLPPSYKLGQEKQAPHIERAKYELCMSYAHAQIYLYRPFLHYLTASSDGGSEGGFPASRSIRHCATYYAATGAVFDAGEETGLRFENFDNDNHPEC